ncbi:MAG: hypothetical protein WC637_10520 [Victivallales bacterium]|jgi:hypothetical protein
MKSNDITIRIFTAIMAVCFLLIAGCTSVTPDNQLADPQELELKKGLESFSQRILDSHGDDRAKLAISAEALNFIEDARVKYCSSSKVLLLANSGTEVFNRVYLQSHYRTKFVDALNDLNSSDDYTSKINTAETLSDLYKEALGRPELWNSIETEEFSYGMKAFTKLAESLKVEELYMKAKHEFALATNPEDAIKACEIAISAIARALKQEGMWNYEQRKQLCEIKSEFEIHRDRTKQEFNELIVRAVELLEDSRKAFVNQMASEDIKTARELYAKEKSKWLNPGFGVGWHWRDEIRNLFRAVSLCSRVCSDAMASVHLRQEASSLSTQITDRFSKKEKSACSSFPSLPSYASISGYPNWNPKKKAEDAWGQLKSQQRNPIQVEKTISFIGNR